MWEPLGEHSFGLWDTIQELLNEEEQDSYDILGAEIDVSGDDEEPPPLVPIDTSVPSVTTPTPTAPVTEAGFKLEWWMPIAAVAAFILLKRK